MTRDNLPLPNCDSDSKADNKRQAFINTDMRRFKIPTGDKGPPPWQGLNKQYKERNNMNGYDMELQRH